MTETAGGEAALGLTAEEAQVRIAAGEGNVDAGVKTRSVGQIVHDNVCTLFNLVNAVLALLVVVVGGTAGACLLMPNVFCIAPLTPGMWLLYGIVATISAVAFHALYLKLEALHAARIRRAE